MIANIFFCCDNINFWWDGSTNKCLEVQWTFKFPVNSVQRSEDMISLRSGAAGDTQITLTVLLSTESYLTVFWRPYNAWNQIRFDIYQACAITSIISFSPEMHYSVVYYLGIKLNTSSKFLFIFIQVYTTTLFTHYQNYGAI